MTVFLVPNASKPKAVYIAGQAAQILAEAGILVLADNVFAGQNVLPELVRFVPAKQGFTDCDIVLTVGGDGTMLHAARHVIQGQKPMLGINVGRLGFLTSVEKDELGKLRRLLEGDYVIEHRTVLQAECGGDNPFFGLALNDIVLFKKAAENTIELDIYCDKIKVSGFRGDGVVFSTPTGSTAYSMSAGGPIVDASLQATIVSHICAHIVHTPPMVFAGNRIICAVPKGDRDEKVFITCDGLKSRELPWNEPVYITQATQTVPLIQFEDTGQLASIDKKLKGR